jgi:hypothetical protein
VDEKLDGVQACCPGGDVVWDGEEISAGCSSYTKLDRSVVVSFLLHDGIVVHDFVAVPAFLWNEIVCDWYNGA